MNKELSDLIGQAIDDEILPQGMVFRRRLPCTVYNGVAACSEEEAIQKIRDAIPDDKNFVEIMPGTLTPVPQEDIVEIEEASEDPIDIPVIPSVDRKKYYLKYLAEVSEYTYISQYLLSEGYDKSECKQYPCFREKLLEEPVFITKEEFDYKMHHMGDNELFIDEFL